MVSNDKTNTYNANGWVLNQITKNASGVSTQAVNYTSYDALGNVLSYHVQVLTGSTYTNTYTYLKYGGAYKELTVAATSTYFQPSTHHLLLRRQRQPDAYR